MVWLAGQLLESYWRILIGWKGEKEDEAVVGGGLLRLIIDNDKIDDNSVFLRLIPNTCSLTLSAESVFDAIFEIIDLILSTLT